MEPQRKSRPEIEPEIRPSFRVIQGGGETTPDRGNLHEVEASDSGSDPSQHLSDQERRFGVIQGGGETTPGRGDLQAVSNNLDNARANEANGSWATSFTGTTKDDGKNKSFGARLKGFGKKKGPLGALITLLLFGGVGGIAGFLPEGALIHIRQLLTNKFDSLTPVNDTRGNLALGENMFSTTFTCKIKIRCRYSGLSEAQMNALKEQGAQLLDKDGKPVTKNPVTRKYTGGKTLILPDTPDGKPGAKINASDYFKQIARSSDLRTFSKAVMHPESASFLSRVSKSIRSRFRLTTNPDLGEEENEKSTNKALYEAEAGNTVTANTQTNTEYEKNPDGSNKLDANGNPIPVQQDPGSQNLDFGDDTQDINNLADQLKQQAANGTPAPELPSDPAEVANMPDYVGKPSIQKGLKSVLGFLNPASILDGLCTVYQLTNVTVITARTMLLASEMRYASLFLADADKEVASPTDNPVKPTDSANLMNLMETPNQFGDSFGDSFSYQDAAYGTVTDQTLTASANGNDTIRLLSTILTNVNKALGGKKVVQDSCNVITDPIIQGVLSLTTFIPGSGVITDALKSLLSEGGMAAAKDAITKAIAGFAEKNLSKDALKATAKTATKQLYKMARGPLALFLAGFLLTKYGVPYIARVISNTVLPTNGDSAMDTLSVGTDATVAATAEESGLGPVTKTQYQAFNQFQQSTMSEYVADMQKQANPFDITNPYSTSNAFAAALYPLFSKFSLQTAGISGILTAPSAILSSLNVGNIIKSTNVFAADSNAELSYCNDDYTQSNNVATHPDCITIPAYPDVKMLTNTKPGISTIPSDVINYLLNDGQIDDNGDPVAGSKLADFKSKCVTDAANKFVGDVGDDSVDLSPDCWNEKNTTTEQEMFRLYTLDSTNDGYQEDSN